jgi:DtxR family transcriptional regulator, Mn-dependent transcriptional regulator
MKRAFEELLEAMWKSDEKGESSLDAIRRRCHVEVTEEELEFVHKRGLIVRERDRVTLTYEGRKEASSVVRRHRLAESLFATVLDLSAEKQEEVACEVEHSLLPELEEGICTLLGHPATCPHGNPIPPGRCCGSRRTIASTVVVNLCNMNAGERGRVSYIRPKNHARLHRLNAFGLMPGTVVEVHQSFPAFCIRFEGTELALDRDVAEDIYLVRMDEANGA